MQTALFNTRLQKHVFAIAVPMVLSNLTIPLLGLTDTAVAGHLEHAWYLGGVALGATLINVLFFLLGFLRMSTTGLTAQAYGAASADEQLQHLAHGLFSAICLAVILLLLQYPIVWLLLQFSTASIEVSQQAAVYFSTRIWSAPATLSNMVIIGWLLGRQNARYPMLILLLINLVNIVLDLLFVLGLGWQVQGIAAASVAADFCGLLLGLWLIKRSLPHTSLAGALWHHLQHRRGISRLFRLNRDIFLRSLCLQMVFAFIAFQGAAYGDNIVAANAILLSFLMVVSYGMDGLAYAAESLTGQAKGAGNAVLLRAYLKILFFWSLLAGLLFSLTYLLAGPSLLQLLTSLPEVRQTASLYLPWLILLPLIACWAYLLDGIFIGATEGRILRNTMFMALLSFIFSFGLLYQYQNHALWAAVCCFMAARAGSLGWVLFRRCPQFSAGKTSD